jgi:hypothetical protein
LAELQVISMIGRVALGSTYLRPFKMDIKENVSLKVIFFGFVST